MFGRDVHNCISMSAGNPKCSCCKVDGKCIISHCTLCPRGMFQDQSAQNECTQCKPGSYARLSASFCVVLIFFVTCPTEATLYITLCTSVSIMFKFV